MLDFCLATPFHTHTTTLSASTIVLEFQHTYTHIPQELEAALEALEANPRVNGLIITSGLQRDVFTAGVQRPCLGARWRELCFICPRQGGVERFPASSVACPPLARRSLVRASQREELGPCQV
jgi:hypothetical protein